MERVLESRGVGGFAWKHVAQAIHSMAKVLEQVAQFVRDIMIKEEVHGSPGDICRATRTSISPR